MTSKNQRRNFLKILGTSIGGLSFLASHSAQASRDEDLKAFSNSRDKVDSKVDKDLKYLNRNETSWPRDVDYFSSLHSASFRLVNLDLQSSQAVFFVQSLDSSDAGEPGQSIEFKTFERNGTLVLSSTKFGYHFFWKPKFGLYTVDSPDSCRPVELCHSLQSSLPYQSNHKVHVVLNRGEALSAGWTRAMYRLEGIKPSPLPGFEGSCEETIQLDSSDRRDQITARGLNRIINTIPMGLAGLKLLARSSPASAAALVQKIIPRVFGWMLGSTEHVGKGEILIHDCPYRKRLGTYPCESTCGHAIGKYFTENVGVPLRFDPTADNYQKCRILIGKDKSS